MAHQTIQRLRREHMLAQCSGAIPLVERPPKRAAEDPMFDKPSKKAHTEAATQADTETMESESMV